MMKTNDIVSIVTSVGEFVGKLVSIEEDCVKIKEPRMIVHNQGGMGFAAGVSMAGEESPAEVDFYKTNIVFVGHTNEGVQSAYRQFTTGLIV